MDAGRRLRWREVWMQGRRARSSARAHGFELLAGHIERSMAAGCFAAAAEFHAGRALAILGGERPILSRRARVSAPG